MKWIIGVVVLIIGLAGLLIRKYTGRNKFERIKRLTAKRAVKPLIKLLRDPDPYVRQSAIRALESIGDKKAVSPLLDALYDENGCVVGCAANALGALKDASAVEPLMAQVERWGGGLVAFTEPLENALIAIGAPSVPALTKRIKVGIQKGAGDKTNWLEHRILMLAAETLGKIGVLASIDTLVALLTYDHEIVRRHAAEALQRITGQSFGDDYNKWNEWLSKQGSK